MHTEHTLSSIISIYADTHVNWDYHRTFTGYFHFYLPYRWFFFTFFLSLWLIQESKLNEIAGFVGGGGSGPVSKNFVQVERIHKHTGHTYSEQQNVFT